MSYCGPDPVAQRLSGEILGLSIKLFGRRLFITFAVIPSLILIGCAGSPKPPRDADNICQIFRERPKWYKRASEASEKWGIPIYVMMAIMNQESGYRADAKPPRGSCLCFFPGFRRSSAYGYAQVKDETWEQYIRSTGNKGADRDDFGDAVDFIGWYCSITRKKYGVGKEDAYNLYLAYHEGHGGFGRKTHVKKKWLLRTARKVQTVANRYRGQLASCEKEFKRKGGSCLWPF